VEQFVKYCLFLFVIGASYELYVYWYDPIRTAHAQGPNDEVIMYAQTTCGPCKLKAQEFEEHGIRFIEYDIDVDKQRNHEFYKKLERMNYRGAIGTPTIEVNSVMLPNNPPLLEITRYFNGT